MLSSPLDPPITIIPIKRVTYRPLHIITPPKTQDAFDLISQKSQQIGLKINDQKTQLLSVSSGFYDTQAVIKDTNNVELKSSSSQKMLGYIFSNTPSVQAQLDYLSRKANKRMFLLLNYKKSGVPKERLRDLYCAMNRSIIEYT